MHNYRQSLNSTAGAKYWRKKEDDEKEERAKARAKKVWQARLGDPLE